MACVNNVNILFLAAGYGTRLQRDIINDPTASHLLNLPKALLPLNCSPLINHWLKQLPPQFPKYIITNSLHYPQFTSWALKYAFPIENILQNNSNSNDSRLGSIPDLALAIAHFKLQDSKLLVIAGDTLFLDDFKIHDFLSYSNQNPTKIILTSYNIPDSHVHKSGILVVNNDSVVAFMEKPNITETDSRLACPCFYMFPKESLKMISNFLDDFRDLKDVDAAGKLIQWMVGKYEMKVYKISGRLDIGGLDGYWQADEYTRRIGQI